MTLNIVNITAAANDLDQPFHVRPLVSIAGLSLSLFVCQGQINWHRHLDEDEMFLVHEGVVALDTEGGRVTLHSEELAVVPKGMGHRSGSQLRSVVLLLRPTVFTNRKNGHRHAAPDQWPPPEKVRLARIIPTMAEHFRGVTVARVEDFDVVLMTAQGFGSLETAPEHGALWLVLRGAVGIEIEAGAGLRLEAGELTQLAPGATYRLSAAEPSLLLTLARASASD